MYNVLTLLACLSLKQMAFSLSIHDHTRTSSALADDIIQVAKEGMGYEELERRYSQGRLHSIPIDGTEQASKLKALVQEYIQMHENALSKLVDGIRDLYHKEKDITGRDDIFTVQDCPKDLIFHLSDLDRSQYRDADVVFHHQENFEKSTLFNYSVVKIPEALDNYRNCRFMAHQIKWSVQFESIFEENALSLSNSLQYFASTTGLIRIYPGFAWETDFVGTALDYDPRDRPWYDNTRTGSKDVVIILDTSESMARQTSRVRSRLAARDIITSLGRKDRFAVIASKSPYWDVEADYYQYWSEFIGCHGDRLIPATGSNQKKMVNQLDELEMSGGSDHSGALEMAFKLLKKEQHRNCISIIVLITDSDYTDARQRCTPGYYKKDDRHGRYLVPGSLCYYDFNQLCLLVARLQQGTETNVSVSVVLVQDSFYEARKFWEKLVCENNGLDVTISSERAFEVRQQIDPLLDFYTNRNWDTGIQMSVPYYPQPSGTGAVLTLSSTVRDNSTHEAFGVAAVDLSLKRLYDILEGNAFGDSYAFLVDSIDSSILVHPFARFHDDGSGLPAAASPFLFLETGNYIRNSDIERVLLREILHENTGSYKVDSEPHRLLFLDGKTFVSTESVEYFYTSVDLYHFSIVYKLYSTNYTYPQFKQAHGVNVLDSFDLYKANGLDALHEQLNLSQPEVPDAVPVSYNHSAIHLYPRSFCQPSEYSLKMESYLKDLHREINNASIGDYSDCKSRVLQPGVLADISASHGLWDSTSNEFNALIKWRHFMTTRGVLRTYPGVQYKKETYLNWESWFLVNHLAKNEILINVGNPKGQAFLFMSKVVYRSPKSLPNDKCRSSPFAIGCGCSVNEECNGYLCLNSVCTHPEFIASLSLEIHPSLLYERLRTYLMNTSTSKHACGDRYKCGDGIGTCSTACYIFNDQLKIVTSTDPYNNSFAAPLQSRQSYFSQEMLRIGIFRERNFTRMNAECPSKPVNLSETDQSEFPLPSDGVRSHQRPNPDGVSRCSQVISSLFVHEQTLGGRIIEGDFTYNPCAEGKYYFSRISGTNAYQLTVVNYRKRTTILDFNCRISRSVVGITSELVSPNHCSLISFIDLFNRSSLSNAECPPSVWEHCHAAVHSCDVFLIISMFIVSVLTVCFSNFE